MSTKLLLVVASTVILGSKFHRIHDQILLSDVFWELAEFYMFPVRYKWNFYTYVRQVSLINGLTADCGLLVNNN
jgi:hypothetical protein